MAAYKLHIQSNKLDNKNNVFLLLAPSVVFFVVLVLALMFLRT